MKRYNHKDCIPEMEECSGGYWVKYDDALNHIKKLNDYICEDKNRLDDILETHLQNSNNRINKLEQEYHNSLEKTKKYHSEDLLNIKQFELFMSIASFFMGIVFAIVSFGVYKWM